MTTPAAVLERVLQQRVELRLKDNRLLAGRLLGLDEHMNLVLEDTEETVGQLSRRLGRVILRGSSVISLHVSAGSASPKHP